MTAFFEIWLVVGATLLFVLLLVLAMASWIVIGYAIVRLVTWAWRKVAL